MKQQWLKLAARIDAMAPRQRGMVFAACALVLMTVLYSLVLEPLFLRQSRLKAQIAQERNQIEGVTRELAAKLAELAVDPDEPLRVRIADLRRQVEQRRSALEAMQTALVPPARMPGLLETILKRNGNLRLVSLRTLPAVNVGNEADATAPAQAIAASAAAGVPAASTAKTGAIYRHGVEIVVEGSYPDMVNYLAALETLQWRIFWGKAQLRVGQHPNATLSLTLYTMSLDPKWMHL